MASKMSVIIWAESQYGGRYGAFNLEYNYIVPKGAKHVSADDIMKQEKGIFPIDDGRGDELTRALWKRTFSALRANSRIKFCWTFPDGLGVLEWVCDPDRAIACARKALLSMLVAESPTERFYPARECKTEDLLNVEINWK